MLGVRMRGSVTLNTATDHDGFMDQLLDWLEEFDGDFEGRSSLASETEGIAPTVLIRGIIELDDETDANEVAEELAAWLAERGWTFRGDIEAVEVDEDDDDEA
ncbi:MAG: hypothetical protein NTZ05_00585 [Chloroflexi bacterium]|nr:hypothetical protein [Chloroflexota bacterium]